MWASKSAAMVKVGLMKLQADGRGLSAVCTYTARMEHVHVLLFARPVCRDVIRGPAASFPVLRGPERGPA